MENRRTESNVPESEPEEDTEASDVVKNVDDPDVSVVDSEVETPKSQKRKLIKKPKMSFEDNLLKLLEARKVEDPVSSFLMSLAPQIKLLNQEKQNQIFIEFLQVVQKVSSTSPSQNTHITPAINNVNSWSIQPPISTFYDRSYDAYSTAINHRPNHVNITPPSSSSTSLGLGAYQSASVAAMPQYYNQNSTQTVAAPVSPSTTLFTYSSLNTDEYENNK
ncbi:uncharacterized protein LOC107882410 [Acyrthosiphon pisum]|uniref:BESS domain-containing protein n=1 Tax=Acyrthosiphon pisum TaxID=7029 RepID=A0A8R2JRE1_ACYPI|nr:uncharacterized protein LOC107882410 [Acyrthosiphon pisum]